MAIEFSYRENKDAKEKTLFVIMDDVHMVMDKLGRDEVAKHFESGFKVALQAIARKKSPDAVVAMLAKLNIDASYETGVEVKTTGGITNMYRNATDEQKARIQAILNGEV